MSINKWSAQLHLTHKYTHVLVLPKSKSKLTSLIVKDKSKKIFKTAEFKTCVSKYQQYLN